MAITLSVVGTMAASFAVDLLRIPKLPASPSRNCHDDRFVVCDQGAPRVRLDRWRAKPNVARACGYAP
jgi:hypothetical protein